MKIKACDTHQLPLAASRFDIQKLEQSLSKERSLFLYDLEAEIPSDPGHGIRMCSRGGDEDPGLLDGGVV